jgi:predicted ester cyclase
MRKTLKLQLIIGSIPVIMLVFMLPFVNRIQPVIFGFPFNLFWIILWIMLTPGFLYMAYRIGKHSASDEKENIQPSLSWGHPDGEIRTNKVGLMYVTKNDFQMKITKIILLLGGIMFFSCQNSTKSENLDKYREIIKQFHAAWSEGRTEDLQNLISPDFVCHFMGGYEWKGIEGTAKEIKDQHISFPDWNEEIVDMISDGDYVVTRYISTGTHMGNYGGLDSTGKKIKIFEISIYKILDGKIVEQWCLADKPTMNEQLGIQEKFYH